MVRLYGWPTKTVESRKFKGKSSSSKWSEMNSLKWNFLSKLWVSSLTARHVTVNHAYVGSSPTWPAKVEFGSIVATLTLNCLNIWVYPNGTGDRFRLY